MRTLVLITLSLLCAAARPTSADEFASAWDQQVDRVWLGKDYWANPMEDWRIKDGRIESVRNGHDRNVHLLTGQLSDQPGQLKMEVTCGLQSGSQSEGSVGFEIGITNELDDYRSNLLIGAGIKVGIASDGFLFIHAGPNAKDQFQVELNHDDFSFAAAPLKLELTCEAEETGCHIELTVMNAETGANVGSIAAELPGRQVAGNIALVSNFELLGRKRGQPRDSSPAKCLFWFSEWRLAGTKLVMDESHAFGPILYAMHSLSRNVMKMTAQMPPLGKDESNEVHLQIRPDDSNDWIRVATSKIDSLSCTATFRVKSWDSSRDIRYRLVYQSDSRDSTSRTDTFEGTVRHDPVDKETIVVAGFTGNQATAFPNKLLASNVAKHDPDMLLFTGDQIYEGVGGYGIHREDVPLAVLNYLRKIYLWGWAFRDVMRDRVSLVLPDDHDVYQGNIWGNGGNAVPSMAEHAQGGYAMHADFVNAVQRTQASHHPDPYDDNPVEQGITVYYGDMLYGRISFAVIEDRKFKSGPEGNVNSWKGRPDHVVDTELDTSELDKPGLQLLGERQLKFLDHWAQDWTGADLKVVCSQTIFCNLANYHGGNQMYLVADLDSNGWPQTGRNEALKALRRGFAFHYAGDQHLPSIVLHGVDAWGDAGYSFCVPSIAAGYPRSWRPDDEGRPVANRIDGLANTGDYRDGLGNLVTVHAVGNPARVNRKGILNTLHDKSSGYGLIRLNKTDRTITMECWRLIFDADHPQPSDQFPGWPKTIDYLDNYGKAPVAFLPTLEIKGQPNTVVQVVEKGSNEIVYTLRIRGNRFRPKVFSEGEFVVRVGDAQTGPVRELDVRSVAPGDDALIQVEF